MDITEEYYNMCLKAKKIQGERKHESQWIIGDYFYLKEKEQKTENKDKKKVEYYPVILNWATKVTSCALKNEKTIWLPTQSQLQKILGEEKDRNDLGVFEYFITWFNTNYSKLSDYSGEQMWLMFTMYSLYSMEWVEKIEEWLEVIE